MRGFVAVIMVMVAMAPVSLGQEAPATQPAAESRPLLQKLGLDPGPIDLRATPPSATGPTPNTGGLVLSADVETTNAYYFRGYNREDTGFIIQPTATLYVKAYDSE